MVAPPYFGFQTVSPEFQLQPIRKPTDASVSAKLVTLQCMPNLDKPCYHCPILSQHVRPCHATMPNLNKPCNIGFILYKCCVVQQPYNHKHTRQAEQVLLSNISNVHHWEEKE